MISLLDICDVVDEWLFSLRMHKLIVSFMYINFNWYESKGIIRKMNKKKQNNMLKELSKWNIDEE